MYSPPLAYFLTFRTYGTWLPGDPRGFTHHTPDARGVKGRAPAIRLAKYAKSTQQTDAFILDHARRPFVDATIRDACEHRDWRILALNVRSNHVHLVVASEKTAEYVLRTVKARATRRLREDGLAEPNASVWARHGSTIHLFNEAQVIHAVRYTNEAQEGERFEMPVESGGPRRSP